MVLRKNGTPFAVTVDPPEKYHLRDPPGALCCGMQIGCLGKVDYHSDGDACVGLIVLARFRCRVLTVFYSLIQGSLHYLFQLHDHLISFVSAEGARDIFLVLSVLV